LTEVESKELLKEAEIPMIETKLARNKREALSLSKELGFPVVLKIVSPDVVHKTDCGGVSLDINNASQVANSYTKIMTNVIQKYPKANIHGISIQKMAFPGIEVVVGVTKDAQFGPVLMFGLGGIFVEVLKDVSFGILPLSGREALQMIKEIKGYHLLEGHRGQKAINISILVDIILGISDFVLRNREVKELDLNPIFAYHNGAVAVDARVILETW
jgi:acetyl-CoA synthetase (ADP-forming)